MRRSGFFALAVWCFGSFAACQQHQQPAAAVEVREVEGNTFELVPHLDKGSPYKFCLVFTRSQTGVVRQLTMTRENMSLPCLDGTPIAKVKFRAPVDEGEVKVHTFLSDQKLNASSIAMQLYERKGDPSFHPMDLRLPGNVKVFTADFKPRPAEEGAPTVGGKIGEKGKIVPPAPDAGTAAPAPVDAGTAAPSGANNAG